MENWTQKAIDWFIGYYDSFKDLAEQQEVNFKIKKNHSLRVAQNSLSIATQLNWSEEDVKTAFLIGLLHDVGRFRQLFEYNTFNDKKSVNHAELGVEILKQKNPFELLNFQHKDILTKAIENHNKFKVDKRLFENELKHAKLIRDADKLDIFKVLTDYYSNKNGKANHTLTWELGKGNTISKEVAKEILTNKLVSRNNVVSELDVKVMQLSWVYDFNYKQSFAQLMKKGYLEIIYKSLPKNDLVFEIYRKVKVFAENQIKL